MITTPAEARLAISRCYSSIVQECRVVLGSELHYQAMIYYHLRNNGGIPYTQIGMNVKTTVKKVQTAFFTQRIALKNINYQTEGIEIIPDITIFSETINSDWRRRNYGNTLRETIYALEIKASERYKSRLSKKELETDILKLVAQREETQHLFDKRIGIGIFIIDVAPDLTERMLPAALNDIVELARLNEVDLWYFNKESIIEELT